MCWPHSGAGPEGCVGVSLKAKGSPISSVCTEARVFHFHQVLVRLHLRIGHHLRESGILRPDQLEFVESRGPFAKGSLGEGFIQQLDGLQVVLHHLAVVVESDVVREMRDFQGQAGRAPVPVALGHGELDPPPISALVGVVKGTRRRRTGLPQDVIPGKQRAVQVVSGHPHPAGQAEKTRPPGPCPCAPW